MEAIDQIIKTIKEHFTCNEVLELIKIYIFLYNFTGEDKYIFIVSSLIEDVAEKTTVTS